MAETITEVVAEIDRLPSVATTEDLSKLQALADQFFGFPVAADHIDVWFRLYERFPDDDGYGVFWSILHGIEEQAGYPNRVVESVRRAPSRFPVLMVNRLLNGRVRQVGDVELLKLLRDVAENPKCIPSVREDAQAFWDHQQSRV